VIIKSIATKKTQKMDELSTYQKMDTLSSKKRAGYGVVAEVEFAPEI